MSNLGSQFTTILMSLSTSELLLVTGLATFWGFIILGGLRGGSEKKTIQRAQAEGRHRIVEISGVKFHAIRKTEIIVRSKTGRALAVLVSTGRERDPHMENGIIKMIPRWIKIRSFTKNGLSNKEKWVNAQGWTHDSEQDIEYHIPIK